MSNWDKPKNNWWGQAMIDLPEELYFKNVLPMEYWGCIEDLKNGAGGVCFLRLKIPTQWLLTFPFSDVGAERPFNELKNIKTVYQSRLVHPTTAGLLECKYGMKRIHCHINEFLSSNTNRPKIVKSNVTSEIAAMLVYQL